MAEQPTTATVRRPRGRPRLSQPGVRVSTWLPQEETDRLMRLASKSDHSVSALVRKIITSKLG